MKRLSLILIALLSCLGSTGIMATEVSLSQEELKLYNLIMQYRAEKGLPSIPLSASLTYVAQTHVRDMQSYPPTGACNLHSWSGAGPWSEVCYTSNPDDEQLKAVWNKPRELTTYSGAGFEISFWSSAGATAFSAIEAWKKSPGHNATMINLNIWKDSYWRAIGIGIYKEYAVVWFGEEPDDAGEPALPSSQPKVEQQPTTPQPTTPQPTTPQPTIPTQDRAPQNNVWQEKNEELRAESEELRAERDRLQAELERAQKMEQEAQARADKAQIKAQEAQARAEKQKLRQEKKAKAQAQGTNWLGRFYDHSGFSSLSYLSFGYKYSCMSGSHLVNMSLFDFRASLFSASLLNVEMSVSPFNKRFSYNPHIGIYVPVTKNFSFVPYGGAEIDASYIAKYMDKNYTYDADNDFYINAIAGLALNLTAAPHVPMEIRVEYRHPVLVRSAGALNPKGIYVGAQIYFGSIFEKK